MYHDGMNLKHLAGKSILITGASSGIGKATAIACAHAGMRVVLAARGIESLEATERQISHEGGQAIVIPCNVCEDASVRTLFEQAIEHLGRIDVMFANAGYGLAVSIADTTDQQIRDIFETNFYGTVRCVRNVLPIMQKQGAGHILICSSACSEISLPMYGYYAATKAAQDSLAGALRAELTGTNIHVTSVHPIGTSTNFFNQVAIRAGKDSVGLNTPDAMMQTPQHVAKCILKCIANTRNPKPEVWPHWPTRFALGLCTAFPRLAAMALRKMNKRKAN